MPQMPLQMKGVRDVLANYRLTVGMPGRRSESRRPSAEAGPTLSLGTGLHVYQVHR